MSELNPNHPALRGAHDHWHKIAALLMVKFGMSNVVISPEEIAQLGESQLNIAIRFDDVKGIELFIIDDNETAKIMARREGGLPV